MCLVERIDISGHLIELLFEVRTISNELDLAFFSMPIVIKVFANCFYKHCLLGFSEPSHMLQKCSWDIELHQAIASRKNIKWKGLAAVIFIYFFLKMKNETSTDRYIHTLHLAIHKSRETATTKNQLLALKCKPCTAWRNSLKTCLEQCFL